MVKGGLVGLALRSKNQDLGVPMKVETQSDSSTANSLTDRLGAGQRTKHIDTRHFWIQERVQDGDLSVREGAHSEELRRCWNEASLWFSITTTLQVCRIGALLIVDPTLHYKMKVTQPMMDLVKGCSPDTDTETRRKHGDTSTEPDSCQR